MTNPHGDPYVPTAPARWAPRSLIIAASVLAGSDILDAAGRWSPWQLIASLYLGTYIPFITIPLIVVLVVGAAIARIATPPGGRLVTIGTLAVAIGWFAIGTLFYSLMRIS